MKKIYFSLLFFILSVGSFAQSFTAMSVPGLTDDTDTAPLALAAGDFNNDGFQDLFVGNYTGANYLYQNNGDGTFTRLNRSVISSYIASTVGAQWTDYNNDSHLDLYVTNEGDGNMLYTNKGDGSFTEESGHVLSGLAGEANYNASWADYDRDGWVDVYISNSTDAQNGHLFKNNGDGSFTEVFLITNDILSTSSASWVDFNRDLYPDLFLVNNSARNQLFKNNGNGTFTEILSGSLVTDVETSWSASWADFDNNYYQDVLVTADGTNSLYRNFGSTNFSKVTSGDITTNPGSRGNSSVGDFDNDGDQDVLVNTYGNGLRLYENTGSNTFISSNPTTSLNHYGSLFMDVNNDGYLDIIAAKLDDTGVSVFENKTSNSNHFVRVQLEGVESNVPALGAHMFLYTSSGTYYQTKISSNGWGADGPGYAHFGIGTDTEVERLWVQWPDGTTTNYYDLKVDELNIIKGMGPNLAATLNSNVFTNVKRGTNWIISASVNNISSSYSTVSFKSKFYLSSDKIIDESDYLIDSLTKDGLGPYNGVWLETYTSLPDDFPLGSYYLIIDIDSDDDVREYNEEDNIITEAIEVTDQDFPNLWNYLSLLGSSYNPGTQVQLYNAYVYNNTNISVPEVEVGYYLSTDNSFSPDDQLLDDDIIEVPSYSTIYLNPQLTIPSTTPIGAYYIIMVVDPGELITEKTRGDNIRTQYVNITNNPVSPSNLEGSPVSTTQIDLTWTDNTTVETNYEVLRNNTVIATLPADTEFYSDVTASAGVTYEYQVRATNGTNYANSNLIQVTIDNSTDAEILTLTTGGALTNDGGNSTSVTWADFDNDEDDDLYVTNRGQANFLYENNGDGTFTKISAGNIVTDVKNSVNASWADFDNDGWIDLYVSNYGEDNNLYRNNGDGTFTDIATAAGIATGGNQGCAWGDYNQDGQIDLFLTNDAGQNNTLYHNNGDGTFSSVFISGITDSGGESMNAMWIDVNNDRRSDLFVVNYLEENELYINQGNGSFSQSISGAVLNDVEASWGASWGDYNNDGYIDLYVTNKEGSNSLYRNNYGSGFTKVNVGTSGGFSSSVSSSWVDFDNDGDLDLFVANSGENNMLFRNNGDNSFTRLIAGDVNNEGAATSAANAWADVNKDGFVDLFVANQSGENNLLYVNSGNTNNFLTVKLQGIVGNRSAIGGYVRLEASGGSDNFFLTRQIMSQNGGSGQNSLALEFGLGDATAINYFEVNWPDGQRTTYTIEDINQTVTIKGMGVDIMSNISSNIKSIVKRGTNFNIDANIRNNNNYASEAFKVAYYLSIDTVVNQGDILLDTLTLSSLAARGYAYTGVTKQISQSLPLGDYHLIMKADDQDVIEETDELNNYVVRDLTITDQDLSDLTTYVNTARYNYNAGTTVRINGSINNNSEFPVSDASFSLVYSNDDQPGIDDDEVMWVEGISIEPYGSYNIDTAYAIPEILPSGNYYVILTADPDNLLVESSESNNSSIRVNYISDYPAQPSNLYTSVASINEIVLYWQDNSNNEESYKVFRNDVEITTLGADVTTYTDNDVQIDSTYIYYIVAENEFGNSYSNSATGLIANIPELLIPETTDIIASDGGGSSGMAWGDYNQDDYVDLFVANNGEPNYLYTNNGDGTFTKVSSGPIVTTIANSVSASWGDFNNDGWLDLYVVNEGQNNFLYKNNGDGTFSNVVTTANVSDGNTSSVWGDYNRDGWIDLYVTNDNNENNILYKNNGDGTFSSVEITGPTTNGGNSISANWVDINNDGWLDLFVTNYQQANHLYTNNGDETFTRWTSGAIVEDVEDSWGGSWGDYDNNGYPDLFVTNKNGKSNSLYRNQYGSSFKKITSDDIVQDGANSESSAWGDYDNDGDLDLFVANIFENNMFYQNDGNGFFTKIVLGDIVNDGGLLSTSSGFADVNNDGFLDLFVTNAAGQHNLLYINSTNDNNWVKFRLKGIMSNNAAIGSNVALWDDYRYQTRILSTQTGARAQSALEVHFGLGDSEYINDVNVEWPDGSNTYHGSLTINQTHELVGMGHELLVAFNSEMATKIQQGTTFQVKGMFLNSSQYVVDSVRIDYYFSQDEIIDAEDQFVGDTVLYDYVPQVIGYSSHDFTIPAETPTGTYYFLMEIDGDNWVKEVGENNNKASVEVSVIDYPLPDLTVSASLDRSIYNPEAYLQYNVSLQNNGGLDVTDVTVNYYISASYNISTSSVLIGTEEVDLLAGESLNLNKDFLLPADIELRHYYLIATIDEPGVVEEMSEGNNLSRAEFHVTDYPIDPSDFQISLSAGDELTLSWSDNSNNELEYVIERDEVLIATLNPDETSYIDSGLDVEQTYNYRIRANNSEGFSNWVSSSFTLLQAPGNLQTNVTGNEEIHLTWDENSSLTTQYTIYRNEELLETVEAGIGEYTDSGVTTESLFTYKIKGFVDGGSSAFTPETVQRILNKPTGLTAEANSADQIMLTWQDNTDFETSYIIERDNVEVGTVGANIQEFTDSDVEVGVQYSYTVHAVEDGAGLSLLSDPVEITIVPDAEGPEIAIVQQVDQYIEGSSAEVLLEVIDVLSEVTEVKAYHRKLGAPSSDAFTALTLTETSADNYTFALSSDMFDELGMRVIFEGVDEYNNLTRTDTFNIYTGYEENDVNLTGLKSGSEVSGYQIFAVPLNLESKNVENVFSGLGDYDKTKWRVFHYTGGENKEYKNGFSNIERGKGYWLISTEVNSSIPLGAGSHSLPQDKPFEISLQSGWNQIGNPYMFNISWQDVLDYNNITAAEVSTPQVFNNGSYSSANVLNKFQGAFVNASQNMVLKVPHVKNMSVQGGRIAETGRTSEGSFDGLQWSVALALHAGEITYDISGIGMHPKASLSRDKFDELTAPRFMNYLEVNFMHPEHQWPYFTRDIVPQAENYVWEFTVESDFDIDDLTLRWDNSILKGTKKQLMLFDASSNKIINMADDIEYTFVNTGKHPFKIIFGSEDYVQDELLPSSCELQTSYPNPFSNELIIPFVLKDNAEHYKVELSIYSLSGEKLITLANGEYKPGFYEVTWDGKYKNGNDLPAGVYLQRMSVINGKERKEYMSKIMKK